MRFLLNPSIRQDVNSILHVYVSRSEKNPALKGICCLFVFCCCFFFFFFFFFLFCFVLFFLILVDRTLQCISLPGSARPGLNCANLYSESSVQRHHLFPKTTSFECICCCTEYLMSKLSKSICKKGLVVLLFPHRTYVLDIC